MKGVILAAGIGKRLRPFTYFLPKPLLRLGDKPIIEHIIDWLRINDINEIIIITNSQGRIMEKIYQDFQGITFVYSKPLGTAGQLLAVKDKIKETFVIVYCDIITNFSLKKMVDFHIKSSSTFTIATLDLSFPIRYGVITSTKEGKVKRWDEKPKIKIKVNSGIYIAEPKIFDYINPNTISHMNELVTELLKNGLNVFSYNIEGEYYDVGTLQDYINICKLYDKKLGEI
jgi:Nucleoside-diphosphate-sugar pyrophosphorylase involved in lipopolysaccharide biosynthesis/translation initiation factor 2B, gamma/epsilon subunits (eIF-2Bgamma/eIF-2Bepsilon)